MSQDKKRKTTVFGGVLDAINANRRKKSTINPNATGMGPTQSMPTLDPTAGVEVMQQQFLDWQVTKIAHDLYTRTVYYDTDRISAYQDFRAMDGTPEIAAAMNIIRDECLTRGEKGTILDIYSENKRIKQVLQDLFKNVLNADFNLRLWIRDLIKYGDYFVLLNVDKEVGVYDFLTLPMEEVHREEGYDGRTSSVRFRWETTGDYFEEWQVAHFRLLEDSRKLPYGRCLKYDTYIETNDGFKFIKDIKKGDIVYSLDLKTNKKTESKVLDTVYSGKKEIYKVRTKNNEIETSIEHRFLIFENGEFVYKNVEDLKIGDFLVINKKSSTYNKIKIQKQISNSQNHSNYKDALVNIPDFVDEDFAKFFGFMLGDGWVVNNTVNFALGCDEKINKKYIDLIEKFSGKKVLLRANPNKQGALPHSYVWVNSKMLKEILINQGFLGNCNTKRLPKWVFSSEDKIKKAIIEGLVDSDGSTNVDEWNCKRYGIELANEYLVKDIKFLLQSLGLKTGKVWSRDRKTAIIWDKKYNTKKSFCLYFYDSHLKNCEKHIKNHKDIFSDECIFLINPIIEIESCNIQEDVYDIYVDNENHNFYANGIVVHNSILDSSRKLWKQLQLAEDAMLVYRVTRAPDRRVFYIEAGNLPDGDIKQYVGKIQNQVRKQPMVDARTGNMTQKYDPENVTEDYWIPIRGDKSSKIETLPGPTNLGDIQDIEYFQNKLFAALQVPKTYLNYAESMPGGSTLSQADIRFSRTINSIQEAILLELRRVANVHLYFLGFEDDLDNFQLTLTNPSTQQELLKLETMKARLEVFKEFFNTDANAPTSYTWAMENVLGFSKSDIKLILKQKKVEKKIFAEIDSAVETYKKIGLFDELDERYEDPEAAQLATGGGKPEGDESGEGSDVSSGGGFGGLSGFGNEFGGGEEMGGEDLGSQEAGGEEGGEEAPPLSESKLTKVMAASDKRANVLISELLGQESEKKELIKEVEEKDNALVKKNKFINLKTKKLIESIENNLGKVKVIEEKKEKKSADLLFEKNKKNNKKTKEIFDKLDEITEE